MDEGLIQILVIAFFIIIAMMDGAARKKRQEAQRRGTVGRGEGALDVGEHRSMKTERMSEAMVPDELWEEIAALARGGPSSASRPLPPTRVPGAERRPAYGDPAPHGTPSGFERPVPARVPEPEETSLRPEHQHVEDHDHVEWASEEEPAEAVGEPDPDEDPGRASPEPQKGRSVRRTLMHGDRESIRQAVILAEVLGPPVSLRDSDHEPPG